MALAKEASRKHRLWLILYQLLKAVFPFLGKFLFWGPIVLLCINDTDINIYGLPEGLIR